MSDAVPSSHQNHFLPPDASCLLPPSNDNMVNASKVAVILALASSWLNFSLYTGELILCIRYFSRPSRPLVHKIAVGMLVFFDTVCTVAISIDTALDVMPPKVSTDPHLVLAPLTVSIIATYVSAAIAQLFLCNLFYILTGNVFVSIGMLVLIFVHVAFSWASGISILTGLTTQGTVLTETTVGAISCAATDIIISGSLAWKFSRMMARTGVRPQNSARSLVRRVLILTVSSGVACAANTTIMMILLLKRNLAFEFFYTCQGRVYALTILGNFLLGIPDRGGEQTVTSYRFGASMYIDTVVFGHPDVSITVENRDRRSRTENARTSIANAPSREYATRLDEPLNVELDDLKSGSIRAKADLGLPRD
ncbi:hypothetical protein B0H16DRAFT_726302 [Mycena metata]|uniref:DUF6534 domain-containing protein n=1 Tax=Mycena metata TaxID=1033252 RepID=A0AAD7K783_9AGAR|nr:hypothetical protein B0H16DRAFT_726302 [Mycena metata]